jgi:hypothetical protein
MSWDDLAKLQIVRMNSSQWFDGCARACCERMDESREASQLMVFGALFVKANAVFLSGSAGREPTRFYNILRVLIRICHCDQLRHQFEIALLASRGVKYWVQVESESDGDRGTRIVHGIWREE